MKRSILIALVAITLLVGTYSSAFAVSSYLNQFNNRYATAGTALDTCSICHVASGPPSRNSYGAAWRSNNYNFATIEPLDSDGDGFSNLTEINARTFPGDAASKPAGGDTVAPTVTAFTIPATSSTLAVAISSLTATDAVGVTGYLVKESSTAPAAGATGWSASAPASFTFTSAGAKTLYAWAKDAAGNVSASRSASVTITLPDTTAPVVSAFTIPATSSTLAVTISSLTATDAVGVTGYLVKESSTAPTAGATGWSASAPASFTFTSAGTKTLYAWAKDAAGNVSASRSASVTITLPDTTAPVVTAFTIPATSSSLTVAVSSLTATDAVGVTGYLVNESSSAPAAGAAGWSASAPASFTFTSAGAKTLYAWAKDAAGNVSASRSASVTITVPQADTTAPTVTAFSIPATSSSLTVAVSSLTATDAVGVTGYLVNESSSAPAAGAAGWSATAPANYTFTSAGAKTLYSWAKDAAGNVSASRSASVTITVPQADTTAPTVTAFSIPATSSTLSVAITSLTATDNVGVTGYKVTETSSAPTAGATGWSASAPAAFTFATAGAKTLYGWAKDAAGNVSASMSASVTITLASSSTNPDLNLWVGKWLKLTVKNVGYRITGTSWRSNSSYVTQYLNIWSWDPEKGELQCDLYEGISASSSDDDDDEDTTVSWISEPLTINYVAGGKLDFLVHSQITGDLTTGFTARFRGWQENGNLTRSSIQTLGGYYLEVGTNQAGSNVYWAGGLSIYGILIPNNQVPVPTDAIVVH